MGDFGELETLQSSHTDLNDMPQILNYSLQKKPTEGAVHGVKISNETSSMEVRVPIIIIPNETRTLSTSSSETTNSRSVLEGSHRRLNILSTLEDEEPSSISSPSTSRTFTHETRKRKVSVFSRPSRTSTPVPPVLSQVPNQLSAVSSRKYMRSISLDLKHTLSTQFKQMNNLSVENLSISRNSSFNSSSSLGNHLIERVDTSGPALIEIDEERQSNEGERNETLSTRKEMGRSVSILNDENCQIMDKAIKKTIAHHSPEAAKTTAKEISATQTNFKENNEFNIKKKGTKQTVLQYAGLYLHLTLATPSIVRIPHFAHKYSGENGSAFLFAYILCIVFVAAPVALLEIIMAQYSSLGPINIYERCLPILKGVGYGMVATSSILMLLSSTWLSWSIFYLLDSLISDLPWQHCPLNSTSDCREYNVTNSREQVPNETLIPCEYYFQMVVTKVLKVETGDALSFDYRLLGIQILVWVLLLVLVSIHEAWRYRYLSWMSSVVTLIVLFILMVTGLSSSGSGRGLREVFRLNFIQLRYQLVKPALWLDALGQIFWSMGPTIGVLIARSSYHNFHHNISRDVVISITMNVAFHLLLIIMTFSYVGHLGDDSSLYKNVGLFFVISSYAVTQEGADNFSSVIWFLCVCKCLLSHSIILVDTVATSLSDTLHITWRDGWRRFIIELVICAFGFLCTLPFVTKEGIYFMTIVDAYAPWICGTVLGLLEVVMLVYVYKISRIQEHYIKMRKSRTSMAIVWKFFTPLVLMGVLVWAAIVGIDSPISWNHLETSRENSYYATGVSMSLFPLVIAGIVFVAQIVKNRKNIPALFEPSIHWGTAVSRHRHLYLMNTSKTIDKRPWLVVQACGTGTYLPEHIHTWIPMGYSWCPESAESQHLKEMNPNISLDLRIKLANLLKNRFSSYRERLSNDNLYHHSDFHGLTNEEDLQRTNYSFSNHSEMELDVRERKSNHHTTVE